MKENFNELDPKWNTANYDEVWNERFLFFQLNGAPNSKTFRQTYKELPGFIMKLRINMNFYAFFFGIIYFFIKGMWKGALTLIGISILIGLISYVLPAGAGTGIGIAYSAICGMTANYTYYRKEVLDEDDFNIFKGLRLI